MALSIQTPPLPLRTDEDGVVRVGNTRITLDTIVAAFLEGATPEVICEQYPSLSLPDVYGIIHFYLANRDQVDAYLSDRARVADQVRRENETRFPPQAIRDRLLGRRPAAPP